LPRKIGGEADVPGSAPRIAVIEIVLVRVVGSQPREIRLATGKAFAQHVVDAVVDAKVCIVGRDITIVTIAAARRVLGQEAARRGRHGEFIG
jgi:hypothetical protein